MNSLRQALEQALNELEIGRAFLAVDILKSALNQPEPRNQCGETCERAKLCAICAQGINLPEREPVAWMWKDGTVTADPDRADGTWTPLYTASTPLTAPKGYALVSIDALKAWNKYDEVLAACQYSIKE